MAMAEEHFMSLQPGTVIGGRYEVVKCLGAGSMGLVYACRHRELLGSLVAVKVLFPEVAQDKTATARFKNEVFASYGVNHPNVVRAYEYLKDGDLVAYTMEYVGGGDLASRINKAREHPVPIADIIKYLHQMAGGVQAIHDAAIVHRDLKPENILLTSDGQIKIADFGIARTGYGPKLTEHGGVVGTIDYVSPEYMLNSHVDWRSDIYALGILSYELLTGDSPFRADSVYATMRKRLQFDPEPPSAFRPDCPPELDSIVLKAMARDPEERYQSGADIQKDLTPLVLQYGVSLNFAPPKDVPQSSVPQFDDHEDDESSKATVLIQQSAFDSMAGVITHPESNRIESVLSYNESEPRVSIDFSIGHKVKHERIRELQAHVRQQNHSSFIRDILWIALAAIVGLGLGFFALTIVKPDIFEGKQNKKSFGSFKLGSTEGKKMSRYWG